MIRSVSAPFYQHQSFDDQKRKGKHRRIGLLAYDKKAYAYGTKPQGYPTFIPCPNHLPTILQCKSQNTKQDHTNYHCKICSFQIGRNQCQIKQRNFLHRTTGSLSKQRQKQQQCHTAIQQPENQITKPQFPFLMIFFRYGQQFITG